ncbi:D-2-hydroxyacid dehydrogenase [Companilactobacillus metriopterae]|uniref:D-2-hydroxyacid dehydrogenase n=1 Tax=Companilactobacillus metriopterae TaxID=1909267 RepID=UPI00100B52AD|nr:D-2-hydroxyacid dehydrogenase [Companilactobacillus metriopterae]
MKIFGYGIREDELHALNQWIDNNPDVEVQYTDKTLTPETAALAEGSDGVVTLQTTPYERAALEKLTSFNIKYISIRNVGYDNFNLQDLSDLDMTLTNVPVYSPYAIAEHALLLAGRLLRRVPEVDRKFDEGDFTWAPTIGKELREQTVGIIGTGHIGQVAAQMFNGMGSKVIGYDVSEKDNFKKYGTYVESLEELYQISDIVDLHVPLFDSNKYMINDESIAKMKDGVFIINAARGELINTKSLIKGLDSGKIAGVGLDVLDNENTVFGKKIGSIENISDPDIKNLAERINVIITPHNAFYTETAVYNMITVAFDSSKKLISGEQPENIVKPK